LPTDVDKIPEFLFGICLDQDVDNYLKKLLEEGELGPWFLYSTEEKSEEKKYWRFHPRKRRMGLVMAAPTVYIILYIIVLILRFYGVERQENRWRGKTKESLKVGKNCACSSICHFEVKRPNSLSN
jgi:hypothetical protein